jgi:hypothetical protein
MARAVAADQRPKPPRPTEADLQARLDAARARLHEIVILSMKTWLPAETLRLHFQVLECFREEPRRLRAERHFCEADGNT